MHLHPTLHWLGSLITALNRQQILWLSVGAIIVAILMAWHHHQIAHRVKQHQIFLSSLRRVSEDATRLVVSADKTGDAIKFIEEIALLTMTTSLVTEDAHFRFIRGLVAYIQTFLHRKPSPPTLVATVLETTESRRSFTLKCQWPHDVYAFPDGGLSHDSAAGRALDLRRLVYVPRTYFSHGIQLTPKTVKDSTSYTGIDLVQSAFVPLSLTTCTFVPRSTICFVIPLKEQSSSHYVLCLDSDRGNHFREMDFEAVDLMGRMIGMVLTDLGEA
jgi:hypothetical protein